MPVLCLQLPRLSCRFQGSNVQDFLAATFYGHAMETDNISSTYRQVVDGVEMLPEGGVENMSDQEFEIVEIHQRPVYL